MKKNFFLFLCSISILGLSSCNSDNSIEQTPTVIEQETSGYISFKYKDILYSSNYEVDGKNYRYENPEVIAILNELQELPNLALLAKSDGSYEYFDSYEELCENEKTNNGTDATTRAPLLGMSKSTLKIHTRTKYRGDYKTFTIGGNQQVCIISDLGTYGLDEQITSMKLLGTQYPNELGGGECCATFFENKNRKGRSCTFAIIYPNLDLGIKDFANVFATIIGPVLPFCMDDQTSSILFYLRGAIVPLP